MRQTINRLRVLTYHRIADAGQEHYYGDPQLISATPAGFERQVAFLAEHYDVVSAKQIIASIESGAPLAKRAVFIGFDDAYRDFKTNAWPVLKKFGLPAAVFVPTDYPDKPDRLFWWDKLYHSVMNSSRQSFYLSPLGPLHLSSPQKRLKSLRRMQNYIKSLSHSKAMAKVDEICSRMGTCAVADNNVLGWDELRQLAREGVEVGAHTRTHPILTRLPVDKLREEAVGSLIDLKREISGFLPIISYPNGNYDATIANTSQRAGFKLGFTMQDGHNDLGAANPLMLRRTNITLKTSATLLRLRLMRLFTYVDQWRHGPLRNLRYGTS